MSELGDIEAAVVSLIEGIEANEQAVFARVGGVAAADRASAVRALERWPRPAAGVVYGGRERVTGAVSAIGDVRLTVLVAASGLRSADAARVGELDTVGAFELANLVTLALEGAAVGGERRLVGIDEQIAAANERGVIVEQRWLAETVDAALPTFGGAVITGSESIVAVHVGERRAASVSFAFPGIDGVYRHGLGARGRRIRWSGQLRATGHASLNEIEAGIDELVGVCRPRTVEDALGRTFDQCVVERFARSGPRRVHPGAGLYVQAFEIEFAQLGG